MFAFLTYNATDSPPFSQVKNKKLRHPLFMIMFYKVGINRNTVVIETVLFYMYIFFGYEVMEKSCNFISGYLGNPGIICQIQKIKI